MIAWLKKLFGSTQGASQSATPALVETWGSKKLYVPPVPAAPDTTQWSVANNPTTNKLLVPGRPSDLPTSDHYASREFTTLKKEYEWLWQDSKMIVEDKWVSEAKITTDLALHFRRRYEAVAAKTGVPWYVVAALHLRESNFNFAKHIHNGDPLSARTVRVPANRPEMGSPPFTWEESCMDALHLEGFAANINWSVGHTFYLLERFNGFGYRIVGATYMVSPYIYSGSRYYGTGKYTSDGKFDMKVIDKQLGVMPFLKMLEKREVEMFHTLTVEGQT